jgi:hypothetical protein
MRVRQDIEEKLKGRMAKTWNVGGRLQYRRELGIEFHRGSQSQHVRFECRESEACNDALEWRDRRRDERRIRLGLLRAAAL